jgi:hypothetical protein
LRLKDLVQWKSRRKVAADDWYWKKFKTICNGKYMYLNVQYWE